jgi:hypothetical protein
MLSSRVLMANGVWVLAGDPRLRSQGGDVTCYASACSSQSRISRRVRSTGRGTADRYYASCQNTAGCASVDLPVLLDSASVDWTRRPDLTLAAKYPSQELRAPTRLRSQALNCARSAIHDPVVRHLQALWLRLRRSACREWFRTHTQSAQPWAAPDASEQQIAPSRSASCP